MNQTVTAMYFSPTGGTKRVVEAIASVGSEIFNVVDLTKIGNRLEDRYYDEEDLLIIGVPVYAGRVPKVVEAYLTRVRGNNTPAVCVAVYGNREYDDALLELKNLIVANGFVVGAAAAFIGEHSYTNLVGGGRPDEEDLSLARTFGKEAFEKFEKGPQELPLFVKGNFPYKERVPSEPMAPVTSEECIFCGLCAEACPTESIDFEDYFTTDAKSCIRCCACIKICPKEAKKFDHPLVEKITASLIKNCSEVRKMPEFFLG